MTILITGATGAVGRNLVRRLAEKGESVRALTRHPAAAELPGGVEVIGADLDDPATLGPQLFEGVDRVFVFPADHGVGAIVDAALQAATPRFVVLSSLAAAGEFPRDIGSDSYVHHTAVENAVTSRTDDWTILRPGTFANNLMSWAWPIRSGVPVRAPYLASAQAPIHEADVADAAFVALTGDGQLGAIYPLTGPQALTRSEQVAAIGEGIGRELSVIGISPEEFRAEVSQFVPEGIIAMLLDYWSDTVETPDQVRSVERLTGTPGRTLVQWAKDHRADFGA